MKVPKATSIFLVVLISVSLLNFVLKYYTYFVLVVSSSKKTASDVNSITQETGEVPHPHELFVPLLTFIPTRSPVLLRPWVLVTSAFVEENFVGLTISATLFFYLGKYLESMWGTKDYAKFVATVGVISNVWLYLYYTFKSWFVSEPAVPPVVLTAMAIDMALLVAIKQRISNHYFLLFKNNVRIKVAHIPFLAIVVIFVLQLISEEFYIAYLLSFLGFGVSWTYLRFYKSGTNERQSYLLPFALNKRKKHNLHDIDDQIHPTTSPSIVDNRPMKGDRSEQFSLYTFFPYPFSLIIKLASNVVFKTLVTYKFLNKDDFTDYDEDLDTFEDIDSLQSNLFGLSPLKGAGKVSTISGVGSSIKNVWTWFTKRKTPGIKTSMDKRRKLALKELE